MIQMLSQIVRSGDRSFTERMAEAWRGSGVRVLHNIFMTSDVDPEFVRADREWIRGLRDRGLDVIAPLRANRCWAEADINQLGRSATRPTSARRFPATPTSSSFTARVLPV